MRIDSQKDLSELIGTEIDSDVGPIPVVAVRAGQIIATQDGQDVDRSGWCEHDYAAARAAGAVFYSIRGTTTAGEPMLNNRLAHGWACGACRKIRQAG